MRRTLLIVLLILIPQTLLANEPGLFNLRSPADMESGQAEIKIQHRFYGDLTEDTLDSLFGADSGGNIGLGIRYVVWSQLELSAARLRNRLEYVLGAGYGFAHPGIPVQAQIDVQFFRHNCLFDIEKDEFRRKEGFFGLLSLQTEPILDRITPVVNLGYDSDEEDFGAGFGLALTVLERTALVQKISVIGEYFATSQGETDRVFTFGIRAETYGHHFDIVLGNSSELGEKRSMAGTISDVDLNFGFNIRRRFP